MFLLALKAKNSDSLCREVAEINFNTFLAWIGVGTALIHTPILLKYPGLIHPGITWGHGKS